MFPFFYYSKVRIVLFLSVIA